MLPKPEKLRVVKIIGRRIDQDSGEHEYLVRIAGEQAPKWVSMSSLSCPRKLVSKFERKLEKRKNKRRVEKYEFKEIKAA